MEPYDFRSDTVTQPTPVMREAMAQAEVGDDVYGEDPNVNELQIKAAEMMGMEAGIFVPSGTMGNLASIMAHCNRGDEIILGNKSHVFHDEAGGLSALGGIHSFPLINQEDGTLLLEDIETAIRRDDPHYPRSKLIAIENTHNKCGGYALSVEYTKSVAEIAHNNGLKFHIDGARIFNAAVDLGIEAKELTSMADSVTFCLSKGLSAPVGSMICGSKDFVYRVLRIRKQLGGGMRQVGIMAAAGIVALDQMVDRLAEDHKLAVLLRDGLKQIDGIEINLETQHTNMIYFNLSENVPLAGAEFEEKVAEKGVLINDRTGRYFRMVTHCWVDEKAVNAALEAFQTVIAEA